MRAGIIKNLGLFYETLEESKRDELAGVFLEIQMTNKKNWRVREIIARQIEILSKIFSDDITFKYILPICQKLCNDEVSIVRRTASKQMYPLFMKMYSSKQPLYRLSVVEMIKGFSASPKYSYRQVFIQMVAPLIKHRDIFFENFVDEFCSIGDDRVGNVRIMLATTIRENDDSRESVEAAAVEERKEGGAGAEAVSFIKDKRIQFLIAKLKSDDSKEVRYLAMPLPLLAEFQQEVVIPTPEAHPEKPRLLFLEKVKQQP